MLWAKRTKDGKTPATLPLKGEWFGKKRNLTSQSIEVPNLKHKFRDERGDTVNACENNPFMAYTVMSHISSCPMFDATLQSLICVYDFDSCADPSSTKATGCVSQVVAVGRT